jgi:23S rRNA (guanosine2251-2'-O)-methyltransferase
VKQYRQRQPQQSRPKKSSLVIGPQAVTEALQAGMGLDRIYVQSTRGGELLDQVQRLAAQHGVPVNKVPVEKLNTFNVENHDGCVAVIAKVQYQPLQDVISWVTDKGETPLFLMLDGITDIRNIGGIARTALCCGVQAIIIPEKGVGALNEDAIQASAGALEKITVCRVNSLMKAVDELHLNGIQVYATEMTAAIDVKEAPLAEPSCIVMGSEDKGVYPALLKICDQAIKIPMHGGFESLNVSVAAGMVLYEAMRQRNAVES